MDVVGGASAIDCAGYEADADECSGFGAVDGVDHFGGGLMVFGFEVEDLASDHAFDGAGGLGDEADDFDDGRSGNAELSEDFVGLGLEGVAARMAVASPKTTWQVGLPRRRSSLSSAGRSSWMSE